MFDGTNLATSLERVVHSTPIQVREGVNADCLASLGDELGDEPRPMNNSSKGGGITRLISPFLLNERIETTYSHTDEK